MAFFGKLSVGSTLVGMCFAILRWVQMRGSQKLSLMRCRTIQRNIKNYIKIIGPNFCSAIGPQSIVLHHPQRKSIVAELREAPTNAKQCFHICCECQIEEL